MNRKFIFILRWFEIWKHFFVGNVSLEYVQFTHQATLKSPRFCIILLDNKPKKPLCGSADKANQGWKQAFHSITFISVCYVALYVHSRIPVANF